MSNEERFKEIYDKYHKLVWYYVFNNIKGDKADHEDVAQQIWMGVWNSIDKIQPGKEHAFLYKVIQNQIHKFYYYDTRRKKALRMGSIESSEEDCYDLSDICDEIARQDDFEYFEILDTVEESLNELEFQIFIEYIQGFYKGDIMKFHNISMNKLNLIILDIKEKLTNAFEKEATLPDFGKRRRR